MKFPRSWVRARSVVPVLLAACAGGANPGASSGGDGGAGGNSTGSGGQGGSTMGGAGGGAGNALGGVTGTGGNAVGGNVAGMGGGAGNGMGGTGAGGSMNLGGAPPAGLVPMFIASGRGGRRVMSCDDGHTWQTNCETDGGASGNCLVVNDEGDHAPWASVGLVSDGMGTFMALYGWFGNLPSAQILRTRDGVKWTNVFGGAGKPQGTYGTDIAFGNGVFAVNAQRSGTHRTLDKGDTWTSTVFSNADLPHRRSMTFVPYQNGRFVSYGDNGRLTYSNDNGVTWIEGTTNCPHLGSFAWGNGVLLAADGGGTCRSIDGGLTWTVRDSPAIRSNVLWTGTDFFTWESSKIARSPDGITWTSVAAMGDFGRTPGVNGGGWPALIARGDTGKFVGIDELGDVFHWSDNGIRWTRMMGPMGTTLTELVFGYGDASANCPVR